MKIKREKKTTRREDHVETKSGELSANLKWRDLISFLLLLTVKKETQPKEGEGGRGRKQKRGMEVGDGNDGA